MEDIWSFKSANFALPPIPAAQPDHVSAVIHWIIATCLNLFLLGWIRFTKVWNMVMIPLEARFALGAQSSTSAIFFLYDNPACVVPCALGVSLALVVIHTLWTNYMRVVVPREVNQCPTVSRPEPVRASE